MANLAELLTGASADDAVARTQARAYTEQVLKPEAERMVTERRMIDLLGFTAGDVAMTAIEDAPITIVPARIKTWFTPSELGIDIAAPYGLELVSRMLQYDVVVQAQADVLTGYAYNTVKPFEFATLYDVIKERGVFSYVEIETVALVGGYAVINVPVETERHNPRLEVKNPRTLKWQPLAPFIGVSAAGKYESFIPPQFREWEKRVEDAYGVIGIA